MTAESNMDTHDRERRSIPGKVVGGIIIIVVGLALLADRLGYSDVDFSGRLWPLVLIVLGIAKMADSQPRHDGRRRSLRSGTWLLYVGCWGLVNEFHLFGFDYHSSWPLLIIGVGLITVWRALEGPDRTCRRTWES